jgi:hypothetical protein
MTTLDVQMSGKALLFKTIDVRQKEIDTEFQAVPRSATIEQVAQMTKGKITLAFVQQPNHRESNRSYVPGQVHAAFLAFLSYRVYRIP